MGGNSDSIRAFPGINPLFGLLILLTSSAYVSSIVRVFSFGSFLGHFVVGTNKDAARFRSALFDFDVSIEIRSEMC